jgi:hypothetical protein
MRARMNGLDIVFSSDIYRQSSRLRTQSPAFPPSTLTFSGEIHAAVTHFSKLSALGFGLGDSLLPTLFAQGLCFGLSLAIGVHRQLILALHCPEPLRQLAR